ncbi:hypothetical protein GUJ93_ZPchr0010g8778 [Zizania palustris]|uniref:Protein kinase domain-containing protein n=1 Tax=Zizania palustris TaxID=103762 RepID=A0A8J6BE87_ZIZPA|nr:hypothetical protein GUJ93_ZPchr0010g8778 [Zizania palustris]
MLRRGVISHCEQDGGDARFHRVGVGEMEGAGAVAEVAGAGSGADGDVQIKGIKDNGQTTEQPSGSEALEMPSTPLPLPREMEWSEHFSFFNSLGGFGGSTDGARGLTSVGLSNSESRPDSVTQSCLNNADERVEELTVKNCISSDVQPEVSTGGSTSSGEKHTVMRGLWGNFTRMACRTSDMTSREKLAATHVDDTNLRISDMSSRENLAVSFGSNIISRSNDASNKEMAVSHRENVNNEFNMPFGNQQPFLSSRLNQSEQRAERENALKGYPFKTVLKGKAAIYQGSREETQDQANAKPRVSMDKIPKIPNMPHDSMARVDEPFYGNSTPYVQRLSNSGNQQSIFEFRMLEEIWYRSPEEISQLKGIFPSNIYSLGVLMFELFCCCETWEMHCAAMSDLRHRILPPSFLSESPKEAGFCLWLLHPDPCCRPKARDILGCDLINEGRDLSLLDKTPVAINEEDTESGLLLGFLSQLKEEKEMQAAKLSSDVASLQTDIGEVERRHSVRMEFSLENADVLAGSNDYSGASAHAPRGASLSGLLPSLCRSSIYEERVTKNLEQLENAYYSMRSTIDATDTNAIKRSDNDALRVRQNFHQPHSDANAIIEETDPLGCFFDGLCKYARYSRFKVRGILKNADILNSPNVICSLSFDRDEEYFAAAGVSKKIKIFEFDALLNDRVDIHYPLIEMPSKSKLSCVCWNSYIKNYLASTDYDGTVQLWDASSGQGFMQFTEHRKRAWSVSFSDVDPTKLASGSDDCCVKVWSINQKNCTDTIRNVANVCCVQLSPYSSRMLAFGSADYKIYCYDLRNTRIPWCTISGHGKAVSYVRFLDPETLISASTDNTLKIWDLNRTNSSGLSTNACSLTLSGHTNEKNFVGLSVHDGYIACGSENNEVFSYYKTFPMPLTSHKFGSIDPITGQETNDDNQQFVSSVCWRGRSNMVVAANSSGSIKVLELV